MDDRTKTRKENHRMEETYLEHGKAKQCVFFNGFGAYRAAK